MKATNSTAARPCPKPLRVQCDEPRPAPAFSLEVVRDNLPATEEKRLQESGCAQRLEQLLRRLEEVKLWYERGVGPDEDDSHG
jgi:hypothetical protein